MWMAASPEAHWRSMVSAGTDSGAPHISSGPHGVPAEEGVGPLYFVFFAKCLHNGAAQNLRPHRLENTIPHTDMAPKAAQQIYPIHSASQMKHTTSVTP